jgi:glycosyltransferase involved in cell wall biosynthesis
MPVYNGAAFLGEAIESVLGQTVQDFEFLIVYDDSTDDSLAIIERYQARDPRIRVLKGRRGTLIGALNEGVEAAKGTFLARMDADDVSLPERLARQVALMEAERADICGSHFAQVDPQERVIRFSAVPRTHHAIALFFCVGSPFPHSGTTMRAASLRTRSLRYGDGLYQAIEDLDLWARMIFSGSRAVNVDEVLLKYRVHGSSISRQKQLLIRSQNRLLIDSVFRDNRVFLQQCFDEVMGQDVLSDADAMAAANFVFLDLALGLRFSNAGRLYRRVGPRRFLGDVLQAMARRAIALSYGLRLKLRALRRPAAT